MSPPETRARHSLRDRDGTVLGEGAGALVLETLEHAQARGAIVLAEIVGYGLTSDAFHLAAPDPEGAGAVKAMAQALSARSGRCSGLSWICAHGTGTQLNDLSETKAIKRVFGERAYALPVEFHQGRAGPHAGRGGRCPVIAGVKATQTGIIPPTIN